MIIKKNATKKADDNIVEKTVEKEPEVKIEEDKIDLFNLDNIDFKQRQERRRGDRRRGFRRIDDRNLISRAREEAQSIKEAAAKEGYQEGLEQAKSDILDVKNAITSFLGAKQAVFDYIAPDILEISVDIAQKIIKKELQQDPNVILDNILALLKGLSKEETKITLRVNPAQVSLLKSEIPSLLNEAGLDAKVLVVPDETIMEGGCIVTTNNGVIDATIETQLAVVSEALREILMAQEQAQQGGGGGTNLSEIFMAVFVLLLIVLLLCELPNWIVNICICLNITLGVVLLMISLYVKKTLELASFPSIILIGTMFRLVLSIASTRLILSKGEAGEVIHAFGTFVTGGNMIVGGVIFLIITVVQFMVITKGAERIAEVAARFALDAMPGKQMTIDADFNAGLISPEEATKKREDLQRESNLFGSMDGAMKFVKGDTIAGIIIVLINIIGGLCIGCIMNQMPIADAVSKYTILTIGDGLASQLPSLLMSIAAGVFMTRSSAANSLGTDVTAQIVSKPNALFLAASFLVLLALTGHWTGLPWLPFTLFAIGLFVAGFSTLINADVQSQLGQLENVRQNMQDLVNPNRMYERLGVDVLSLQVGSNLLVIADPDQEGQLLAKIAALRQRVTDELGYILPNIRIMDSSALDANEYMISIRGNTVATGYVYPGKLMVIADQWDAMKKDVPQDAIIGIDPTYQTQAYWISPEDAKTARSVTAVDSTDVIVTHLQECVRKHVDEVMTKTDVLKLMELVRSQDPTLVNDLVPTIISTSDLRKIFVNLIREKVSIKDIIFVFERLCDYARFSKEPDILSERLRAALGRQICLSNVGDDKVLYALTLSPEWEKTLDDNCQRTELGTMFLLNPMQVQELIETTATTLMRAHQACGQQPVILCSPRIRLPLYQLLERHIPTIVVISYSELITDIKVEAIDTIGESYQMEQ